MKFPIRLIFFFASVSLFLLSTPIVGHAQNCVCAACGRSCGSGHATNCKYYVSPTGKTANSSTSSSGDLKTMVVQSLFNAMLNSKPTVDKAKLEAEQKEQQRIALEKAKQQRINDSLSQIAYQQLIKMSKPLPNSNSNLDFKNLNGDMEQMSAAATNQFMPKTSDTSTLKIEQGTNFFGIPVADPAFQTLMEPDNDPIIVDLREANDFIVGNLKTEAQPEVAKSSEKPEQKEKSQPKEKPKCADVQKSLAEYVHVREKFKNELDITLSELDVWKKKNDAAFWNAVTDGINSTVGVFTEYVISSRTGAGKILEVIEKNEADLIAKKAFTPQDLAAYKKMLSLRAANFNMAEFGKNISDVGDYYGLIKNTIQSYTEQMMGTDSQYKQVVETLKQKGFLSDFPVVEASQFMMGKAIDSFMKQPLIKKGFMKISYVTIAQLAVDEAYNAVDWYTSYKNICTFREASGKELQSAVFVQKKIDESRMLLKNCQ